MNKLFQLFERSKRSSISRTFLNFSLSRAIPFNRPHHIRIHEVNFDGIRAYMPYRKSNLNHLRGMHACALATLSEFTAGTALLHLLKSDEYRLIMKEMNMTYHYQARKGVFASCKIPLTRIEEEIRIPLQTQDAVFIHVHVEVLDEDGKNICTGKIDWQIKKWNKVTADFNDKNKRS
jgi:acyl-coenzyme A thioesterase PaaI-like protein